jgi:transcriptional regulator with XRE-family HTH domain
MNNLKKLRKDRKLSQSDIAEFLNITANAYGHYELGKRQPNPETLVKLADFYGVSIDYILGRDDTEPEDPIVNNINIPNDYKEIPVALYHAAKGLTQKEADAVVSFIELIKSNKDEDKK